VQQQKIVRGTAWVLVLRCFLRRDESHDSNMTPFSLPFSLLSFPSLEVLAGGLLGRLSKQRRRTKTMAALLVISAEESNRLR
jgi:hypothetical protein